MLIVHNVKDAVIINAKTCLVNVVWIEITVVNSKFANIVTIFVAYTHLVVNIIVFMVIYVIYVINTLLVRETKVTYFQKSIIIAFQEYLSLSIWVF